MHFAFARDLQICQLKDQNFWGVLKLKCSEISEDFCFFNSLKKWEVGRNSFLLLVIFKPKMLLSWRCLVDIQRNICSWCSRLDGYCATLLMPVMTAEWISRSMSASEVQWHLGFSEPQASHVVLPLKVLKLQSHRCFAQDGSRQSCPCWTLLNSTGTPDNAVVDQFCQERAFTQAKFVSNWM